MAKKFYQCLNPKCLPVEKGRFMAELGTCPQCGANEDDPKRGRLIHRLVMVHYDPPSEVPGFGQGVRACNKKVIIQVLPNPGGGMPKKPWQAGTGNVYAVTCPDCKETEEWKRGKLEADCEDGEELPPAVVGTAERLQPLAKPA
jgi:ssDNA-binding Zn-finger/Zn-ribbon topoisomerase 1